MPPLTISNIPVIIARNFIKQNNANLGNKALKKANVYSKIESVTETKEDPMHYQTRENMKKRT